MTRAHPEAALSVAVPFPPAVNNLYATVRRGKKLARIPSKRYEAWRRAAHPLIVSGAGGGFIAGAFRICLTVERPDKRRRDLDGLAKAVLDSLVSCHVIEDDSMNEELTMRWAEGYHGKSAKVMVEISTW